MLKVNPAGLRAVSYHFKGISNNPAITYHALSLGPVQRAVADMKESARNVGASEAVIEAIQSYTGEDGNIYVGIPRYEPVYAEACAIEFGTDKVGPRPFMRAFSAEWEK